MFLAKKVMKISSTSSDFNSIRQNISNETAYLPADKCMFGIQYYQVINTLKIVSDTKYVVDVKALSFIKALLFELDKRLPDNLKLFQELQYFSPKQCLNQLHTKFSNLPFIHQFLEPSMFSSLEVQWENIININWSLHLSEEELDDSYAFWAKLYFFKDAGGSFIFRDLSEFVLKVLQLLKGYFQ